MIRRDRWYRRCAVFAAGLSAALLVGGCSSAPEVRTSPPPSGPPGALAPAPQVDCAERVADPESLRAALSAAGAGDTICVSGDLRQTRLEVTNGGSANSPVRVLGDGRTMIGGITVDASNVNVEGFVVERPRAPGASLRGSNITLQNVTIHGPWRNDGDGVRFWGENIRIVHNTITDTRNDRDAHADCMQTFATDEDSPASRDVLIDANRCERIDNNCLIVEGPNSSAGDGSGVGQTENITFRNNYCENQADQAVLIDGAQHVVIANNEIVGSIDHAFALQNHAVNAVVKDNRATATRFEVGMDESSRPGYQGPSPGGAP